MSLYPRVKLAIITERGKKWRTREKKELILIKLVDVAGPQSSINTETNEKNNNITEHSALMINICIHTTHMMDSRLQSTVVHVDNFQPNQINYVGKKRC